MSSDTENERPKRKANPAWLATMARFQFKPGLPGQKRCASITKGGGNQCGRLAAFGTDRCIVHMRQVHTRLLNSGGRFANGRKPTPKPPKRVSPAEAHAAPRALRALPVWRLCTGQRERAALVLAYEQRDVHPEAWRKAVRDVHERARDAEPDT